MQTDRQTAGRPAGEICNRVYREYAEAGGTGFLEIAGESFRRQVGSVAVKKRRNRSIPDFCGKEGYADETMQIRAMELSKEGLERTATAHSGKLRRNVGWR